MHLLAFLLCQDLYEETRQAVEDNPVVPGPIPVLLTPFSDGTAPLMLNVGFAFTDYAPKFSTTQAVLRVLKTSQ